MTNKFPYHIAIILDGNRRYARKHIYNTWRGHELGAEKVNKLIEWVSELGVRELTLYTFSIENFGRNKKEVSYLMELFRKNFSRLKKSAKFKKEDLRINFIGRLNLFPVDIQEMMQKLMRETRNKNSLIVNFAIGYSGRSEIVDAVKKIVNDTLAKKIIPKEISEEVFASYLYMSDEPDMIIRTGGEIRISNFLIYQGAYSEWYFIKKLWPEITKRDIIKAINDYKLRERRYGR